MIAVRRLAALQLSILVLAPTSALAAGVSISNTKCTVLGSSKKVGGVKYVCTTVKNQRVWQKAPATSSKGQPVVTPVTPVSSSKSLLERWESSGSNALKVYRANSVTSSSQNFKNVIEWSVSPNFWTDTEVELRRRVSSAVEFWNSYYKFEHPIFVNAGVSDKDYDWACEKLRVQSGSDQWTPSRCREDVLPNPDITRTWNMSNGGTSQWFLFSQPGNIKDDKYWSQFEYNMACAMQQDAGGLNWGFDSPCWFIKSGSLYVSLLSAGRSDVDGFLQRRAQTIIGATGTSKAISDWTAQDFTDWVVRLSVTRWGHGDVDACNDDSGMYHHGLLAAEWLVDRIGMAGYVKLIAESRATSWTKALTSAVGLPESEIHKQMGEYMFREVRLVLDNPALRNR